jgi:hypothetical protein
MGSGSGGGGIGSRPFKHVSAPKVEPRARAMSPGGVGQLGSAQGNHVTNRGTTDYRGEPLMRGSGYNPPVGPTNNVAACVVGGGRTIHKTGTQDQHGPVAGSPKPSVPHILGSFGPDYKR